MKSKNISSFEKNNVMYAMKVTKKADPKSRNNNMQDLSYLYENEVCY